MSGYQPIRTSGGAVISGRLNPMRANEQNAQKLYGKYRAVVVSTRVADEFDNDSGRAVECDIVLSRSGHPLGGVPVMQSNHGVNNASLWIPRSSSRDVVSQLPPLFKSQTPTGAFIPPGATSLGKLDGDQVVVEFFEGDVHDPIITGALSHRRSNRKVVGLLPKGSGWAETELPGLESYGEAHKDEAYFHHQGCEVRVNSAGDLLVDVSQVYSESRTEIPTFTGKVRVRLSDTLPLGLSRFTIQVGGTDVLEVYSEAPGGAWKVDIGENANEVMVLGKRLATWLANHTHSSPAGGFTGIPTGPAGFIFGGEAIDPVTGIATFHSIHGGIADNI